MPYFRYNIFSIVKSVIHPPVSSHRNASNLISRSRSDQILKEMQDEQRAMNNNPAEMQAQAHAAAVKRFTGGGFAVN